MEDGEEALKAVVFVVGRVEGNSSTGVTIHPLLEICIALLLVAAPKDTIDAAATC